MSKEIHVVAAAIVVNGKVFLAKRPLDKHKGGLWEFPGGKVESGESSKDALVREIKEELGAKPLSSEPLIDLTHSYPEKKVRLEVFVVEALEGIPHGAEGQETAWFELTEIGALDFPEANAPIVDKLLTRFR